jgi:hypothetical protein
MPSIVNPSSDYLPPLLQHLSPIFVRLVGDDPLDCQGKDTKTKTLPTVCMQHILPFSNEVIASLLSIRYRSEWHVPFSTVPDRDPS